MSTIIQRVNGFLASLPYRRTRGLVAFSMCPPQTQARNDILFTRPFASQSLNSLALKSSKYIGGIGNISHLERDAAGLVKNCSWPTGATVTRPVVISHCWHVALRRHGFCDAVDSRRMFSGLTNASRGIKNPYYRKRGLYEWRKRLINRLNAARFRRRFLTPKVADPNEAPVKSKDGHIWEFKVEQLPISKKRLLLYTKLLTHLHLQDAIDWLNAMPTIRTNRILNSLSEAQVKINQEYKGDVSRLYIQEMRINYTTPLKQIKYHALGNFGIQCTWRNVLVYKIRQVPMHDLYQRIVIQGKVPRSMAVEMREALYKGHANQQMVTEWYPYLTAHTRFQYKRHLKRLHDCGQFEYYLHRRRWIQDYQDNLEGHRQEQRRIRGLDIKSISDLEDETRVVATASKCGHV